MTKKRKSKKKESNINWAFWRFAIAGIIVFLLIAQQYRRNNWDFGSQNKQHSIEEVNPQTNRKPTERRVKKPRSKKQKPPPLRNNSSFKVMTWNLNHLGKSKNELEIHFIADVMKDFDIVALQEVVTSPYGAKAAARLEVQLDRLGTDWDFILSDPTTGHNTERYAFFWKTSKFRLKGKGYLEQRLSDSFDREPMLATFEDKYGHRVLVANYHARTIQYHPEVEIGLLDELHQWYEEENLVICGDFNLPDTHMVFEELRIEGLYPVVQGTKTSLKRKVKDGIYVSNPYDNIFYEKSAWKKIDAGVVDFVAAFMTLEEARKISDHLPVWTKLEWQ